MGGLREGKFNGSVRRKRAGVGGGGVETTGVDGSETESVMEKGK